MRGLPLHDVLLLPDLKMKMSSVHISPVCILLVLLNVIVPDTLVGVDDVLNTGCYICNHFWHWHAQRPLLFVCSIFIMHYGQCYAAAALCGPQSLRIICSMVNSRCRHATVCISNQLLPAQLQYTFYLQFRFRNFNTLNILWKLSDTYSSDKIAWFLASQEVDVSRHEAWRR